jgi:hypothetical protein
MSVDGMWYVKLADGDVDRVTLEQLDEAFQNGQIDETSMVLADGADQWTKLSDLLGLSEDPERTPAAGTQAPDIQAPVAVALPQVAAAQPPIAVQPKVVVYPALPTHQPSAPPVLSMRPPPGMPPIPVTASLRPVSVDLGSQIELGDIQFRAPSRKRWVVGMLGTSLVLGAGAFFVVTRTAASARADAPAFAAAAAQPPPPVVALARQAMNAGPSSVMDPTQQPQRLTDDQKRKLLDAEKSVKPHPKSRGGGGGGSSRSKEKSSAFTTDGNKFDPLNSTL